MISNAQALIRYSYEKTTAALKLDQGRLRPLPGT